MELHRPTIANAGPSNIKRGISFFVYELENRVYGAIRGAHMPWVVSGVAAEGGHPSGAVKVARIFLLVVVHS